MKYSLAAAAVAVLSLVGSESPTPSRSQSRDYRNTVFFAVLEGLYRDGVSTETATLLTARGEEGHGLRSFVYGCPICIPAVDALTVYAGRATFPHRKMEQDTFGDGWSEDRERLLADSDPRVRIDAVQSIVLGYMNDRLGSMRLTETEQESWRSWLSSLREKGNALLEQYLAGDGPMAKTYAGWKKCGACEGAAGAMQP